jgi:murein tripeptide amidase MpaA
MVSSAGARTASRALRVALACALAAVLTGTAAAQAATGVRTLPTTTSTLTIGGAAAHTSCLSRHPAGTNGIAIKNWVAPADGAVRIRLAGTERDDWDLALFRTSDARRLDGSQAWGANEIVDAVVRRGQSLTIQACRLKGVSARLPLQITEVAAPLAKAGAAAPTESMVEIPIANQADFALLDSLGLNLDEVPNGHNAIAVISGPADAAKITNAGFTYRTLVPDAAKAERGYRAAEQKAAAKDGASALPSGRTTYRQYTDIQADLKKIVADHPNLARPVTLPKKTFQGRDITGIEVTDNVSAADDGKPTFFLMGEHHAREWPSAEIPTEFGIYITNNFGSDARVTALLKKVRIVIVPVINVDGYLASRGAVDPADNSGDPQQLISLGESVAPPGGSLAYRRKNCDGASPSPATPCELQYGIDPNRNYGQNWGGPGAGTDPNDQDYRGSDQWSEPETQSVHEFSQSHDITTLITMHNFASLVLRPPGVHDAGLAPDEDALKTLGDRMADDTGYTSEYSYQLYDTSGTTEDWNYAAAGTYGYTIEMGPSSDKGGNFHIDYARAVVAQWTGSETDKGKGKGLRDALLAAGEEAANRGEFSTLQGTAPPDSVLRLHKNFKTSTAKDICTVEDTDVPCTAAGATIPQHSQDDHLDYTTVVPANGKFNWIVTPSTRPFELKAGKTEQWTLTCENPVSKQVLETRLITVDRGQTLGLDLPCGGKAGGVGTAPGGRSCVDRRKLALQAHTPRRGKLLRIVVFVNDKRVATLKGKRARRGRIILNKLKPLRGHYKVTVVVYGSKGYRRISTRVYKGCKKGKPHSTTRRGNR